MRRLLARRNGTACPVPVGNPRPLLSNVRVGYVLTLDSFYGCEECAAGDHGPDEDGRPGVCRCCRWDRECKAGTFIPVGVRS